MRSYRPAARPVMTPRYSVSSTAIAVTCALCVLGALSIPGVAIIVDLLRDAPPAERTIFVGVGCGFDKRIIVWAGEEDDVWPAMCDTIERHAVYAPR